MQIKKKFDLTILLVLIGIFMISFSISFINADITYITVETLDDFSCTDDTFVDYNNPNTNYGNLGTWKIGNNFSDFWYFSYFKFNLSNKPENFIKGEISLTFFAYGIELTLPFYVLNTSWTEEIITWNDRPFPELTDLLPFTISADQVMGNVKYYIDITAYTENELLSFMLYNQDDYESEGYSKEHLNINVKPKIIWTYEIEHTIESPNDLVNIGIGLASGLAIGIIGTAIPFIIKLRKRSK